MNQYVSDFFDNAPEWSKQIKIFRADLKHAIESGKISPQVAKEKFRSLKMMNDFFRTAWLAVAASTPLPQQKHIYESFQLRSCSIKRGLNDPSLTVQKINA